jgi:hypothetical protein
LRLLAEIIVVLLLFRFVAANRVKPIQIRFDFVQGHSETQRDFNSFGAFDERPGVLKHEFGDFVGHTPALSGKFEIWICLVDTCTKWHRDHGISTSLGILLRNGTAALRALKCNRKPNLLTVKPNSGCALSAQVNEKVAANFRFELVFSRHFDDMDLVTSAGRKTQFVRTVLADLSAVLLFSSREWNSDCFG